MKRFCVKIDGPVQRYVKRQDPVRINPMLNLGECNYQLSFKCLEFDFLIQDWGPYCRRFWILVLADQAGSLTNLLQICKSCLNGVIEAGGKIATDVLCCADVPSPIMP